MTDAGAREALESVFRAERAQIIAVLIRLTGDFSIAEDALQESFARALERWPGDGVPDRPGAWITTTARRRAIDLVRRRSTRLRRVQALERLALANVDAPDEPVVLRGEDAPYDDRLRLLFTCCHPALSMESQVALTLRMVAGLTTREIARAFLCKESAMGQRLTRAKHKIREAEIPFRVPPPDDLPLRLDAVLAVIYLVFNEGYASTGEDKLVREDLCAEAVRLGRLLNRLLPEQPEVESLLALMLLHGARHRARTGSAGELITLEHQDRSLWDEAMIEEGLALLDAAIHRGSGGGYQIQAAIAALHSEAESPEDTDWQQIAALYVLLMRRQSNPVVELNYAVAVGMACGPPEGLILIDDLDQRGELGTYHRLAAARAELLARAGDFEAALRSYETAIEQCDSRVEREYLERRHAQVKEQGSIL